MDQYKVHVITKSMSDVHSVISCAKKHGHEANQHKMPDPENGGVLGNMSIIVNTWSAAAFLLYTFTHWDLHVSVRQWH